MNKKVTVFPALRLFTKSMLSWVQGLPFVDLHDISCKLHTGIYNLFVFEFKNIPELFTFSFTFGHVVSYKTTFKTREILSQTT